MILNKKNNFVFKKSTMKKKEIEFWENHYLNKIEFTIKQDISKMMDALNSKDKIRNDWINAFKKSSNRNSDFARGAERIYFWLFNQFGIPNSSPIGSDLFFETYNAFVHIDIKTAKINNKTDYKGRIAVGKNQTSYSLSEENYTVNLPTFYQYKNKICLTYFINIIYEEIENEINIKAIYVIAVPNGKLSTFYGYDVYNASKNKGSGFRYKYQAKPKFELLKEKPYRIRRLFLSKELKEEDIIGFKIQ